MKTKIALLFSLIFFCKFSLAQAQTSQTAGDLLDEIANKFKGYKSVKIDFTFSMVNEEENIKDTQKGEAWMKGNMYKLNLMGAENYYDGAVIYTYMADVQEVTVKNPSEEEENLLNPTELFSIHKKGFTQKIIQTTTSQTSIELTPIKEGNFKYIRVWVNPQKLSIDKVIAYGIDGNNIEVQIESLKEITPTLVDSFFKFDAKNNPEVTVIDMR